MHDCTRPHLPGNIACIEWSHNQCHHCYLLCYSELFFVKMTLGNDNESNKACGGLRVLCSTLVQMCAKGYYSVYTTESGLRKRRVPLYVVFSFASKLFKTESTVLCIGCCHVVHSILLNQDVAFIHCCYGHQANYAFITILNMNQVFAHS